MNLSLLLPAQNLQLVQSNAIVDGSGKLIVEPLTCESDFFAELCMDVDTNQPDYSDQVSQGENKVIISDDGSESNYWHEPSTESYMSVTDRSKVIAKLLQTPKTGASNIAEETHILEALDNHEVLLLHDALTPAKALEIVTSNTPSVEIIVRLLTASIDVNLNKGHAQASFAELWTEHAEEAAGKPRVSEWLSGLHSTEDSPLSGVLALHSALAGLLRLLAAFNTSQEDRAYSQHSRSNPSLASINIAETTICRTLCAVCVHIRTDFIENKRVGKEAIAGLAKDVFPTVTSVLSALEQCFCSGRLSERHASCAIRLALTVLRADPINVPALSTLVDTDNSILVTLHRAVVSLLREVFFQHPAQREDLLDELMTQLSECFAIKVPYRSYSLSSNISSSFDSGERDKYASMTMITLLKCLQSVRNTNDQRMETPPQNKYTTAFMKNLLQIRNYRPLAASLVSELLTFLPLPDWPCAAILLEQLLLQVLKLLNSDTNTADPTTATANSKKDTPYTSFLLDLLGSACEGLKDVFLVPMAGSDETEQEALHETWIKAVQFCKQHTVKGNYNIRKLEVVQMNTIGKRSSDHVNQTSGSSKRQRDFAEVEVTAEDSEEFDAFTNKSEAELYDVYEQTQDDSTFDYGQYDIHSSNTTEQPEPTLLPLLSVQSNLIGVSTGSVTNTPTTREATTSTTSYKSPIPFKKTLAPISTIHQLKGSEANNAADNAQKRRALVEQMHSLTMRGPNDPATEDESSYKSSDSSSDLSDDSALYYDEDYEDGMDDSGYYCEIYTAGKARSAISIIRHMIETEPNSAREIIDLTCSPCNPNNLANKEPAMQSVRASYTGEYLTMQELRAQRPIICEGGKWKCYWCMPNLDVSSRNTDMLRSAKTACASGYDDHLKKVHRPKQFRTSKLFSCRIARCTYRCSSEYKALIHFYSHRCDPWFRRLYMMERDILWREARLWEDAKICDAMATVTLKREERYCIWVLSQTVTRIEGFRHFEAGYCIDGRDYFDADVTKSAVNAKVLYVTDAFIMFAVPSKTEQGKMDYYIFFFECDEDGHVLVKNHEESTRTEHIATKAYCDFKKARWSDASSCSPKLIFIRMNADKEKKPVADINPRLVLAVQLIVGILSGKVIINKYVTNVSIAYEMTANGKHVLRCQYPGWKDTVPIMQDFKGWPL